jgi:hypothetical protein
VSRRQEVAGGCSEVGGGPRRGSRSLGASEARLLASGASAPPRASLPRRLHAFACRALEAAWTKQMAPNRWRQTRLTRQLANVLPD